MKLVKMLFVTLLLLVSITACTIKNDSNVADSTQVDTTLVDSTQSN